MLRWMMLTKISFKNNKAQSLIFAGLICICTILLCLEFVSIHKYFPLYQEKSSEYNAEHVMAIFGESMYEDEYFNYVKNSKLTSETELSDCQYLQQTTYTYNKQEVKGNLLVYNYDNKRKIGNYNIKYNSKEKYEHPVYLPVQFKLAGGFDLGDKFSLLVDNMHFTYKIAGFYEEMILGSINGGMTAALTEKDYDKLTREMSHSTDCKLIEARCHKPEKSVKLHENLVEKYPSANNGIFYDYTQGKYVRTFTTNIIVMLIAAFVVIMLIVNGIVIKYSLQNSIDEQMTDIGMLKAIGYTGFQLCSGYGGQFLLLMLVGNVVGIAVTAFILPIYESIISAVSGMIWTGSNFILEVLLTIIIIAVFTFICIILSVSKCYHVVPLKALYNEVSERYRKKSVLPLEKVKGNLQVILALKQLFCDVGKQIYLAFIMLAVSIPIVFAFVLFYNSVYHSDIFHQKLVGEYCDISCKLNEDSDATNILNEIQSMDDVDNAIYYDTCLASVNKAKILLYITEDYYKTKYNICYKGRSPKTENEVAIGGVLAKSIHKDVGQKVTIKNGDKSTEYKITGLIQSASYLGNDAQLTKEGYKKLDKNFKASVMYIYLKNGVNRKQMLSSIKKTYTKEIDEFTDSKGYVDTVCETYDNVINAVVVVILVVTLTISFFVLLMLIKNILKSQKREFGIEKALGYSNGQIVFQIVFRVEILALIGSFIGIIITYFTVDNAISTLLNCVGIMNIGFIVKVKHIIIIGILLNIFVTFCSICLSRNVRSIEPSSLID